MMTQTLAQEAAPRVDRRGVGRRAEDTLRVSSRHAAANIIRALHGLPHTTFRYRDCGNLATIGRAAAVAERGSVCVSGLPAWLLWLVVHIFWLIGFRNRFLVLAEWAWAYLRYERGARLITGDSRIP